MTTGFASYQQLKVMRKSKNSRGKGVGRHPPAALRAGMLRSPPGEPEPCEDLFWQWEHFWLNPRVQSCPGQDLGNSCFCSCCLWSQFMTQTYSKLLSGWEGSAGLLGRLQLPPGALAFTRSLSGVSWRDWGVVNSARVPHPELCHQETLWISSPLLFRSSLLIEGLEGTPSSCLVVFSDHVHLGNALQTSKAEVPWHLLLTNSFLSVGKSFCSSSHFPFCISKSIPSVFCTCITDRERIFQPAKVALCLTLTGPFHSSPIHSGSFLKSLCAISPPPFCSLVGRYFRKLS